MTTVTICTDRWWRSGRADYHVVTDYSGRRRPPVFPYPEQMALLAIVAGMIAATGGLTFSTFYDTPACPSVVLCASMLFC